MLQMMLRPKWIAALVLALGVAAIFAALAQWQISRAATEAIVQVRPTETVLAVDTMIQPSQATPQSATGQRLSARGAFTPGDTVIVAERLHSVGDPSVGWWVVAHFVTDQQIDLPVVIGWASTEADATQAANTFDALAASGAAPTEVQGRFLPSDAPVVPSGPSQTLSSVSVGQLINVWEQVAPNGPYFGYIINEQGLAGLQTVTTPAPEQQAQLNWLNIFYGVEWVVFAGFAIYMWVRLVRDAVERERATAEAQATGADR